MHNTDSKIDGTTESMSNLGPLNNLPVNSTFSVDEQVQGKYVYVDIIRHTL